MKVNINQFLIPGKKSFAFSCDGDLIEVHNPPSVTPQSYYPLKSPEHSTNPWNTSSSTYESAIENPRYLSLDLESPTATFDQISKSDFPPDFSKPDFPSDFSKQNNSPDKMTPSTSSMEAEEPDHYPDHYIDSLNANAIAHANAISNANWHSSALSTPESPRRASDSSCGTPGISTCDEGRRFSDGIVKESPERSRRKIQGKRTLQRQARIKESDMMEPSQSEDHHLQPTDYNELKESDDTEDPLGILDAQNPKIQKPNSKKTFCDPKKHHLCCKSDQMERICGHEKNSEECCYYKSTINCWQKMQRIMKKNEKLENEVAKSRREMAEIREMLNSVLLVRMEPGF